MPAVLRRKLLAVAKQRTRKTVGQWSLLLRNILEGIWKTPYLAVQSRFVTVFNEPAVVFAESDLRLLIPVRNDSVSQWGRPYIETALALYLAAQ
jgi:hypothetical protein